MDITHIADWFDILYKALTGIFVVWMFFSRKDDKTHARINDLEKRTDTRLDDHSDRLSRIETNLENAIGNEDLIAIHRRVDDILKVTSKTEGQLETINSNMKTIMEFLIKGISK